MLKKVNLVPAYIGGEIEKLELESMTVEIGTLTAEQEKYLCS